VTPENTGDDAMRTDEYEISLSREMSVCRRMILGLNKTLAEYEKKYHTDTETFLAMYEKGKKIAGKADSEEWKEYSEAMKRWELRLFQYEDFSGSDKIDS
jgi:hypothetical protein